MKPPKLRKHFINDVYLILIMITIAFFVEARAPKTIITAFYIITLYLFYVSKKNYIWIAFILIMYNYTGGLFGPRHDIITFGFFSLSYLEGFSIVALIKASSRKKARLFLKKPFIVYAIYFIFLIFLGALHGILYGKSGFGLIYLLFRNLLLFPLFYSMPVLIDKEDSFKPLAEIFFAMVFINLLGQFFTIVNRESFFSLLSPYKRFYLVEEIRPLYGYYSVFLTLFLAFYFYSYKKGGFKRIYLSIVIFMCILSIFITATRGWIIAVIVMLVGWIIINFRSLKVLPILVPIFIVLFLLITGISPVIEKQLIFSKDRMATLEQIGEGDLTANHSLSRLTTRNVPVMEKFYEKPVFGWGISKEGFEANDIHVGNQSILMSGGIVGMLVILYLLFYIIKRTALLKRISRIRGYNAQPLTLIYIFILGLFIIHSTSTQLFGYMTFFYSLHFNKLLFMSLIFTFFNVLNVEQYGKCVSLVKKKVN